MRLRSGLFFAVITAFGLLIITPSILSEPTASAEDKSAATDRVRSLREERLALLGRQVEYFQRLFRDGRATIQEVFEAEAEKLEAQLELAASDAERIEVLKDRVAVATRQHEFVEQNVSQGVAPEGDLLRARAEVLRQEIRLALAEQL